MAEPVKKPSILSKVADALTDNDEEAALKAAQAQLTQAQAAAAKANQELAALKSKGVQTSGTLATAQKALADSQATVKNLQTQLDEIQRRQRMEETRLRMEAEMKASIEAAKPKFIKEHTMTSDETLSHLSLKYYGSATKPYWMLIYEANKDVIGDNPNKVKKGLVVKIPVLPESMKKK